MFKSLLCPVLLLFSCFCIQAQENWELLNPKPSSAPGLDIHFISDTEGFYLTFYQLYHTQDAGKTWNKKLNLSGASRMVFNGSKGLIVGNSGRYMRTTDSGSSWAAGFVSTSETLNSVNFLESDTIIISGTSSFFISNDGGMNWSQKALPGAKINETFFINASTGHAVSDNGQIFKTTDGGDNWYTTLDFSNYSPNSFYTIYFIDDNVGFATREHAYYYKTTDGGETWQQINTGISEAIYKFQFIDNLLGFGISIRGVYKTENGGDNWSRISPFSGVNNLSDVNGLHFFDANRGFAVGDGGFIANTDDAGTNWNFFAPIRSEINQIELFPNNTAIIRSGSNFYGSSNNGDDWEFLSNPNSNSYRGFSDFIDENTGFCAIGFIYKTNDGGKTWQKLESYGLYFDSSISAIEFVDENLGFISGGFNQKRTYKTTDGGAIWRAVLHETLGKIQFLDKNSGYGRRIGYATDLIFKTSDGGENWTPVFSSEDDILDFHFINDQLGYIVGRNGLAYKTNNGGQTWQKISLPYAHFEKIAFYNSEIGFVADQRGKIYKTINGGLTWNVIHNMYGLKDIGFNDKDEIFLTGTMGRIFKSTINLPDLSIEVGDASDVTANSARINSFFTANSGDLSDLKLEYGELGKYDKSLSIKNSLSQGRSASYEVTIANLDGSTDYNYRAVATFNGTRYVSETKTLRTLPDFILTTHQVHDFNTSFANVSATIIANDTRISEISFEYGKDGKIFDQVAEASITSIGAADGPVRVQANLEPLESDTPYQVRIAAIYNGDKIYGNIVKFRTRPEYSISNYTPQISGNSVTLTARAYAYSTDLTEISFEYGPEQFTKSMSGSPETLPMGQSELITATLMDLDSTSTYYYRIKAKLGEKEVFGPEGIFSLSENTTLLLDSPYDIKRESAIVAGRVYTNVNALREVNFEYGLSDAFEHSVSAQPRFVSTNITVDISASLPGLLPDEIYYYRIRGMDAYGNIYYSEIDEFRTLPPLPSNNFKIITTDETCPDKRNGSLKIESVVASDYQVNLGGLTYNFNKVLELENLSPGIYSLSISEMGSYKAYQYEFEIGKSEQLEAKVSSSREGHILKLNFDLEGGSPPFQVSINGEKHRDFDLKQFSIFSQPGDVINVTSANECEGNYTLVNQEVPTSDVYLNPIDDIVAFSIPEIAQPVRIELYDVHGRLLETTSMEVLNQQFSLDLSNYSKGVYFVKIYGDRTRTHKILKK